MAANDAATLFSLVRAGHHEGLTEALANGADPNASGRWGESVLSYAAGRGDLTAMRLLLTSGADPSHTSRVGNTPLMAAAARGHVEAVQFLLEQGADPQAVNKWGLGARDWANWAPSAADIQALLRS